MVRSLVMLMAVLPTALALPTAGGDPLMPSELVHAEVANTPWDSDGNVVDDGFGQVCEDDRDSTWCTANQGRCRKASIAIQCRRTCDSCITPGAHLLVTRGTCSKRGRGYISTKEQCEAAAATYAVEISGEERTFTANNGTDADDSGRAFPRPAGCVVTQYIGRGQRTDNFHLFFRAGNNYGGCSDKFRCLCVDDSAMLRSPPASPPTSGCGYTSSSSMSAQQADGNCAVMPRKNILSLSEEEQEAIARSVLKMKEGFESPFFEAATIHGAESFFCPHGGMEWFPYWHRAHIAFFETKLQDAHEELYGNRHIRVPYIAWEDPHLTKVLPDKMREVLGAEGSVETAASAFSTMLGSDRSGMRAFRKLLQNGYTLLTDEQITTSCRSWSGAVDGIGDWLIKATTMGHLKASKGLEGPHGSIHKCMGFPMTKIDISAFSVLFYFHHTNVDRLWEAYAQSCGPTCLAQYSEAATFPLAPFVSPSTPGALSIGSAGPYMTPVDTYNTTAFGYTYQTTPPTGSGATKKYKKYMAARSTDPTGTTVHVSFGQPSGCGSIGIENPTFETHFFLVPNDALPSFVLPTVLPMVGEDFYIGTSSFFGGASMAMNNSVEVLTEYDIIDGATDVADYTVKALFSFTGCPCDALPGDACEDEEDAPPSANTVLLEEPTFLCQSMAQQCNGTMPPWREMFNITLD